MTPEVAAHAELAAKIARDRPEVRATAAPDLDSRHRLCPRFVLEHSRFVNLNLTGMRPRLLAAPRELVRAHAIDLHRGKRRWLLEDASGKALQREHDVGLAQRAGIANRLALGFRVIGRGRKPQVDVCDISLRETQGELGKARRGLEEDWQHARRKWVEGAGVSDPVRTCQPAKAIDDGERGFAGAFIDIQNASGEIGRVSSSARRHRSPPWRSRAPA
jgi:hypothetical protein